MALRIAFTLENRLADIHRIRDINGNTLIEVRAATLTW